MLEAVARVGLLLRLGEVFAEGLINVGAFLEARRLLAVLYPHQLDGQLAVLGFALHERIVIRLQIAVVFGLRLLRRVDQPLGLRIGEGFDGCGVEPLFPDYPRGRGDVALAAAQHGGDVALAHAASEQHEEHSLLLGHMSSFLSAAAYSAVGKKSRDAMRRYQIQAISGTTMC